jgi:diguanylate cyclase (GGDEF)-like protein
MSEYQKREGYTPRENIISILPAILAGIIALIATTITALVEFPPGNPVFKLIIIAYGVLGSIYLAFFYLGITSTSNNRAILIWSNSILGGLSLGFLTLILPDQMDPLLSALMITATISTSIVSDRGPAYFIVISATVINIIFRLGNLNHLVQWMDHLSRAAIGIIAIETIQQLKNVSRHQINRLEVINNFSSQIASTLDTQQVLSHLNAAIQNSLEADTYFVGLVEGDEILLDLFYDEGEYFSDVHLTLQGSLSGWVIRNQKELFLPDLRQDLHLSGVQTIIIGKQKTSLSWMGVPMKGTYVNGMIAIASYRPYAFDRTDMRLLSNLAQHATLALDNTFRHAIVEEETHLDSLTGVFNHGYFIEVLREQMEVAFSQKQPLSLIMLDIDHFKQFNDVYGHLFGDEILTNLCETIRQHIKRTDAVGRWGGEEFAISLPNTGGGQAMQVAERIRETMVAMRIKNPKQSTVPAPTVSQGIALFPLEAFEGIKLIDLADHRLYVAKERGRNQIEPDASHWDAIEKESGQTGSLPA